jgi:hypothetical protein
MLTLLGSPADLRSEAGGKGFPAEKSSTAVEVTPHLHPHHFRETTTIEDRRHEDIKTQR